MAKIVHSMIRVFNPDLSIDFYNKALNMTIAERKDFEGFSLIYLRDGDSGAELELTYNHDQKEPYTIGNGYGHLAVVVEDVESEHKRLIELDLKPGELVNFEHNGELLAKFFFIKDPDGYEIEVMEKVGRYA